MVFEQVSINPTTGLVEYQPFTVVSPVVVRDGGRMKTLKLRQQKLVWYHANKNKDDGALLKKNRERARQQYLNKKMDKWIEKKDELTADRQE